VSLPSRTPSGGSPAVAGSPSATGRSRTTGSSAVTGLPPNELEPAAVLWDMDGTLVDTEPYWIACEFDLVAAFGGAWSLEQAHNLVGKALPESGEYLRVHGGVPLSAEEIVDRLLDGVVARVRRHIPWRPGAQALLERLVAGGVPCALVTMSYRRLTEAVLAGLPAGTFATVVAGDDVRNGKPHPEPYLTAAARLGVAPAGCVAIEDSPTGVASAEAAGVPVLAVTHLLPIPDGPGRHVVGTLEGLTPTDLRALAEVP
jgi:HAD superfamily hydrolase (TIGR01509 family)